MGFLVGGLFGLGAFLCLMSGRPTGRPTTLDARRRWRDATATLCAQSGLSWVTPLRLASGSAAAATLVAVVVYALTRTLPLAVAFALFAAAGPRALLRRRARGRVAELRAEWPDVVDNLASAVRAGLSLPEALGALAETGPAALRPAFRRFAEAHRASGAFGACLDRLAAELADPVADRVIEAIRLAREVGGTDLGGLLRTLSAYLREDARVRGEVAARQSWTVNAARLALAAPWVVLLMLATQSTTLHAYDTTAGTLVLLIGGLVSWLAYLAMRRIGRLPEPVRGGG